MIVFRNPARISTLQDPPDAFLHGLKSLPVAARGYGVPLFMVIRIGFQIPRAAADAVNQFRRDAIALDRQRMIRVCHVGVVDALHVRLDVAPQARPATKLPSRST